MSIPVPADVLFNDPFQQILSGLFPFFLVLVFLLPVYGTVYDLVREKEQRSKESMRMMGMSDFSYWLSWFSFYMLQASIITVLGWAALNINVINGGTFYIFFYIWLFGFAVFG
jgi:ATP-binding cassette, subfamily A (ABC1), member 3